jgi:hypothetical protein
LIGSGEGQLFIINERKINIFHEKTSAVSLKLNISN